MLLTSAADIPGLVDRMAEDSCEQPARVPPCGQIVETVDAGDFRFFHPLADGVTVTDNVVVEVTVRDGAGVSVYISGSDPNPGPYHHDLKDESADRIKTFSITPSVIAGSNL